MPLPDFSNITIDRNAPKSDIVAMIQQAFAANGYGESKLGVRGSDPLIEGHIPCIGINTANSSLQGEALGESEVSWKDDDTNSATYGQWFTQKSVFFEETVELRVWHKNSDERDKLGHLLKGILFACIDYMTADLGYVNIKVQGGRDEQENNTPFGPIFWYTITVTFWNPLVVDTQVTDPSTGEITDVTVTVTPQSST